MVTYMHMLPDSAPLPRPVYILSGAPRLAIDAIRYCCVHTSGATGRFLQTALQEQGLAVTLVSSLDSAAKDVLTYTSREELDTQVQTLLRQHPTAVLVSAAAINDYQVHSVQCYGQGEARSIDRHEKLASGADEVVIRLRSAAKLIDQLPAWGHRGPLVACKYEDAESVVTSAQALQKRTAAAVVLANSICGRVQSLVDANGVASFPQRQECLNALAQRIALLATSG